MPQFIFQRHLLLTGPRLLQFQIFDLTVQVSKIPKLNVNAEFGMDSAFLFIPRQNQFGSLFPIFEERYFARLIPTKHYNRVFLALSSFLRYHLLV
jgi:hypothetical protein